MKIKILSDSTCDLPAQLLEKYDISLVPLTVVKDGKEYTCMTISVGGKKKTLKNEFEKLLLANKETLDALEESLRK